MKKFFSTENIRGVGQSLVASVLFLVLLEPIIKIGKNLTHGLINAFVDYFFYSCARVDGIDFICYGVFYAFLWFVMYEIHNFSTTAFSKKDDEKTSAGIDKNTNLEPQERKQKTEDLLLEISKLKKKEKCLKCALRIISKASIVFWILFLCNIVIYKYAPATVNQTFNRKIIQITPYIEISELELLRSEWVSMESKDDYDRIVEKIDYVLIENNLK